MAVDTQNVDHIPTHQETVDKCFKEFEELAHNVEWAKGAFEQGCQLSCKTFLAMAEADIEVIRTLVGGIQK